MEPTPSIKKRKYTGPAKGTLEAKQRMEKVRAAQWAKNGLVVSESNSDAGQRADPTPTQRP